jgi:hypothetical protein
MVPALQIYAMAKASFLASAYSPAGIYIGKSCDFTIVKFTLINTTQLFFTSH